MSPSLEAEIEYIFIQGEINKRKIRVKKIKTPLVCEFLGTTFCIAFFLTVLKTDILLIISKFFLNFPG